MKLDMNNVGGRKFVLAISTLASATLLTWFGHIADGVYSAVAIATCAAYIGGNVAQKINTPADK